MLRWKVLPEELDPRVRELVVQLRRLKDTSELSLAQTAAKTGYSTSSWERYFNGQTLPPRAAVEALARACNANLARLLALHEVATDARGRTAELTAGTDAPSGTRAEPVAPPAPPTEPRTLQRRRSMYVAACVLAVTAAVVLLTIRPWQDNAASVPTYTCRISRTDGLWYAGISRARTAIVQEGMVGPEVAETQCLLLRAGYDPGGIDGVYGDLTQRAVRRLQTKDHLAVDGVVGPHTWGALRG
ncbi:peptidoglycan-binding protein [Streptomyces sp. NPDC046900]|uniref:peptidoglycan-binding protein n=1 Tax=Streptomyces sp. NPDC046900 TaxID=3155473 RepID=UPI0033C353BB